MTTAGKQVLPSQQTVRTEQFWQVRRERPTLLLPYYQAQFIGEKTDLELKNKWNKCTPYKGKAKCPNARCGTSA